jgi:hypothetical protein
MKARPGAANRGAFVLGSLHARIFDDWELAGLPRRDLLAEPGYTGGA